MKSIPYPVALVFSLCFSFGCDSDNEGGTSSGTDPAKGEGASCAKTSDCPSGQACLVYAGHGACTITCDASASECRGEASCAGVGVAVDVCQPPDSPAVEEVSAEEPPDPKDQPRVPCASDSECAALQPGLVCAQWRSFRDCTVPCTTKSQCNPPSLGVITVAFFDCAPDESDTTRNVCLPDPRCIDSGDPMACITIEIPGGF